MNAIRRWVYGNRSQTKTQCDRGEMRHVGSVEFLNFETIIYHVSPVCNRIHCQTSDGIVLQGARDDGVGVAIDNGNWSVHIRFKVVGIRSDVETICYRVNNELTPEITRYRDNG